jgi:glutathione S-transferase
MESAAVNKALGVALPADKEGMIGYGNYALVLDGLEKMLPSSGYLCGDRFTAADVYVGANIGWGLEFGSIDRRPIFEDYAGRVRDREAYRRAMATDDAAMPTEQEAS